MKVRIKNPIWGVPISFLDKYCPTQFEIVDITRGTINGKPIYARICIRKKKAEPIVEEK